MNGQLDVEADVYQEKSGYAILKQLLYDAHV